MTPHRLHAPLIWIRRTAAVVLALCVLAAAGLLLAAPIAAVRPGPDAGSSRSGDAVTATPGDRLRPRRPGAGAGAGESGRGPRRVWPVHPVVLLRGFDPPGERWLAGHRGVDLAAGPGARVESASEGVVTFAADVAGRAVVVVQTGGLRLSYEPVAPTVRVGQQVRAGDLLGRISPGSGHCGLVAGCLHWGLRRGATYLDPWWFLRPSRPVLLPLPWP